MSKPVIYAILAIAAAAAGLLLKPAGQLVPPPAANAPAPPDAESQPRALAANALGPALRFLEYPFLQAFKPVYVDVSNSRYDGKVYARFGDLVRIQMKFDNCRDTPEGHQCDKVREFDHPYNDYSFAELNSIAEFDAAASFILGSRIFEDDEYKKQYAGDTWYQSGVDALLNASILSGSQQPYVSMMINRGLAHPLIPSDPSVWNQLEQSYIWSKAGIDLGYLDPGWPGYHAALEFIKNQVGDDAQTMIDGLNGKAGEIRDYLIDKKARTTG